MYHEVDGNEIKLVSIIDFSIIGLLWCKGDRFEKINFLFHLVKEMKPQRQVQRQKRKKSSRHVPHDDEPEPKSFFERFSDSFKSRTSEYDSEVLAHTNRNWKHTITRIFELGLNLDSANS